MMQVAIYDVGDGRVLRRVSCPVSMVDIQVGEGEDYFLNCPVSATHIINGEPVAIETPTQPPSVEAQVAAITTTVQRHLDVTAQARKYDNMLSLASYATSSDPVFAAEAMAGIAWRDACWRYCYQQLALVQNGERPMPTPEEAVAELPPILWPELS